MTSYIILENTLKPLNSGHLRVLKNLSVIRRYPLLGGSLTKFVPFETKILSAIYSRHVCYLGCPLLGGFTVSGYLPYILLKGNIKLS